MKLFRFLLFPALSLLAGCMSFEYKGAREDVPSTGDIRVYADSAKIGRRYKVLGEATVSGNYQNVSRDRMIGKLTSEAQKCGANAVLIVEQQVLPGEEQGKTNSFRAAFDYDDTSNSWSQLYRDVDQNFANPRRERQAVSTTPNGGFRRIIRAEFLRYTDLPAQKENKAAEAKK